MKSFLLLVPLLLLGTRSGAQSQPVRVDVCVYGGTSAGVMAAYTAKKMGKSVLLIEPGRHLGGLTSGGLGYTDIGNKYAITGLALDYYRRLGKHYGTFEQWIFEPGVAENLFRDYVKRAGVEVLFEHRLAGASKHANGYLQTITLETAAGASTGTNRTVKAGMFIDAT